MVIFFSVFNFLLLVPTPKNPTRKIMSFEKSCQTNQRILQGAVELYNMDNNTKMTSLDIPILIKGNYIKEEPNKPTKE